MMLRFEFDAARARADAVGGASDGQAATRLATAMTDAVGSLPGSSTSAAAREVADRLSGALDALDGNLDAWAAGVHTAGQVLADTDHHLSVRSVATGPRAV